jgi:hypothetical protein
MSRIKGILVAATFTGLVLLTILALGFGSARAKPAANTTAGLPASAAGSSATNLEQELQAWQTYSAGLEQTVRIMQQRESQYQQQLQLANQTILQLQNQLNNNDRTRLRTFFDDDESHELGERND